MKIAVSAYDKGRGRFIQGKPRKPTNDLSFMEYINSLELNGSAVPRVVKGTEINEWKRGWDEAKAETEAPAKPVKKKTKKKAKKKASK